MNTALTGSSARVFTVHNLRTHVLQGPAHCHEHVIPALLQLLCQPKVYYPEIVVILDVGKHDVEGLQVQVENTLIVDKVDTPDNLQLNLIKFIFYIIVKDGTMNPNRLLQPT